MPIALITGASRGLGLALAHSLSADGWTLVIDGRDPRALADDAAVEAYGGWGGYGSSKAALDHLTRILAVEHPGLRVYAVDPGDLRTRLHQEAFPGEDISDRPLPEVAVPGIRALIDGSLPSGR